VDKNYLGKPLSDILVIGVTDQEEIRRAVENRFVAELKTRGVAAIITTDTFTVPKNRKLEKEVVVKAANASQSDGVLIVHLIAVKNEKYYKELGQRRRRNRTKELLVLRTDLYDVKTEKRIWSGQSETWNPDSNEQVLDELAKVVIDALYDKELLPKL
jgi:ABC-type branched-subunit amino acid transport system substrate-binding protein